VRRLARLRAVRRCGWPERIQPPSIERIRTELKRAMAQPEIVDKFVQGSLVPAYSAPDVFETQVRSDVERFERLVKAIGIQLQ